MSKRMPSNANAPRLPARRGPLSSERGSSLVEASLLSIFVLIPLLLGAIDFGRGYYVSIEVANAARAGVQYGAQNEATLQDTTNIIKAVENEAPDVSTTCGSGKNACWVSGYPQAQWGCECSNTSTSGGGTDSCSLSQGSCTHLVNFVVVTTKATYTPMFNFRGLFPPITLNSEAKMRFSIP
jgi:Flp pilus assembly protein TadG